MHSGAYGVPALNPMLLCSPCATGLKLSLKNRNLKSTARQHYILSEGGRKVKEDVISQTAAKTSEEEERGDAWHKRRKSSEHSVSHREGGYLQRRCCHCAQTSPGEG